MSSRKFAVIIILGLFVLSLTGCATPRQRRGDELVEGPEGPVYRALDVAPILRFDDIPVPSGFKIVQESSFTFQNDYTRVGLLRYTGRINTDRVVTFYKDQMSLFNWEMVNLIEYGTRMFIFEKQGETCVITVSPATMNSTNLIIHLAPKAAKNAAKRAQRPEGIEK